MFCIQVVPSDDLEEDDSEEAASPSLLNDELRQEQRARQAKMHRSGYALCLLVVD